MDIKCMLFNYQTLFCFNKKIKTKIKFVGNKLTQFVIALDRYILETFSCVHFQFEVPVKI